MTCRSDDAPQKRLASAARTDVAGDGRYFPPGRGHLSECHHDAMTWVWELIPATPTTRRETEPETDQPKEGER